MDSLIERIEAATSNDPELFWEAQRIANPEPSTIWKNQEREVWTPEYAAYIACGHRFGELIDARAFMDAATTLVPDDCMWLRLSPETMTVSRPDPNEKRWAKHFDGAGKTPALALCAAALKARTINHDA